MQHREPSPSSGLIAALNERSKTIFRAIVEAYVETGAPVGSRTLSRRIGLDLSPATVRNVMADLEDLGLLFAPHTSAGRLPTEQGLRLFVDGILEQGNITTDERTQIDGLCAAANRTPNDILNEATGALSGLSRCAGLVLAPKMEEPLKHIEFVALGPGRALVVLVTASGNVENRIIDLPIGLPASSLVEASNYLAAHLVGRTLAEAEAEIQRELETHKSELDNLTQRLVETGLAVWSDGNGRDGALILRGQAQLLENITAVADLERVRLLFQALETKESLLRLLDLADVAEGVQIFIGAENELFGMAGCSLVLAPYSNASRQIVGAIGVIGPTRINYARIIPMVDYTSKVICHLLS